MNFQIQLDIFRGPMDLMLYLVRQHELEIAEVPVAKIAEQYLQYLEVLREIDVNAVGEFLEVAATLVEMKSRLVLPHGEEPSEEAGEPAGELVQRLLEYKKIRDAASMLEERGRQWQQRFPRLADDSPPRRPDPATQPIHEVELWDLVSAFGRIIRDNQAVQPSNIVYDDTPIHVYMERIHGRLRDAGRMAFSEMFVPGMHKSAMIGVFLAVLELVRHHSVVAEQSDMHGEIWVMPGVRFQQADNWKDAVTSVQTAGPDDETAAHSPPPGPTGDES